MTDDRCKSGRTIQILLNVIRCNCWFQQIIYNKFQHFLRLLQLENFMIILCICQTSTPMTSTLIIMMSQRDVINETTVKPSLCAYWEKQSWNLLNAPHTWQTICQKVVTWHWQQEDQNSKTKTSWPQVLTINSSCIFTFDGPCQHYYWLNKICKFIEIQSFI